MKYKQRKYEQPFTRGDPAHAGMVNLIAAVTATDCKCSRCERLRSYVPDSFPMEELKNITKDRYEDYLVRHPIPRKNELIDRRYQYHRDYKINNKERLKKQEEERQKNNPESVKAKREYNKTYKQNNKERLKKQHQIKMADDPEYVQSLRDKGNRYYQNNKERIKQRHQERMQNDPEYVEQQRQKHKRYRDKPENKEKLRKANIELNKDPKRVETRRQYNREWAKKRRLAFGVAPVTVIPLVSSVNEKPETSEEPQNPVSTIE